MTRTLYGLSVEDGSSISPYVWRTRFALARKELAAELVNLGFADLPRLQGGKFKTVPVLDDDGVWVGDSWVIADHLDQAYPDRPRLFSGEAERAMVRLFERWLVAAAFPLLFRIVVLDIFERLRPADRDYFRASREARFGHSLEAIVRDREAHVQPLRQALEPLRATLRETPFLAGDAPNYADFIGWGVLLWTGSVSTLPLLAADDPIVAWVQRGRDLHGGIGREIELPGLAENA